MRIVLGPSTSYSVFAPKTDPVVTLTILGLIARFAIPSFDPAVQNALVSIAAYVVPKSAPLQTADALVASGLPLVSGPFSGSSIDLSLPVVPPGEYEIQSVLTYQS